MAGAGRLLHGTLIVALLPGVALAHKPSDSYLRIDGASSTVSAEWDIALRDLELLLGLDANGNGEITWGELKSQQDSIAAHALSRLSVKADGRTCELAMRDLLVTRHSDGAYAVLVLEDPSAGRFDELEIEYQLLFDVDPTHRGLVLYDDGLLAQTHILSPEAPTVRFHRGEQDLWRSIAEYVQEGVWHIWMGFDHILFLLSLLIPAVLVRRDRTWTPLDSFRPAWTSVLKVVTCFTVAHSITLWLSVMEYVTLPSQLVEATIALSIVITALNNLYPLLPVREWVVAFVFGLVHGFGFANVLLDLGLSNTTLAVSLLGFNVGVELGQIALVAIFVPIAFLLRSTRFYLWGVLRVGSALIAILAGLWLYERTSNVEILGF